VRSIAFWCLLVLGLSSCGIGIETDPTTDTNSTAESNLSLTTEESDLALIDLQLSTTYQWSVRTNSENGQGAWSNPIEFSIESSEENAMAALSADAFMFDYVPSIFDDGIYSVPDTETLTPIGPIADTSPVFSWNPVEVAVSYDIRIVDTETNLVAYTENYDADDLCASGVCQLDTVSPNEDLNISSANNSIPTASTTPGSQIVDTSSSEQQTALSANQPDLAAATAEQAVEEAATAQISAEQEAEQLAAAALEAATQATAAQRAAEQANTLAAELATAEQAPSEQAAFMQAAAESAAEEAALAQAAANQAAAEQEAARQAAEEQAIAAQLAAERTAAAQEAAERAAAERAAAEQAAAERAAAEQAAAEQAAAEQAAAEQAAVEQAAAEQAAAEQAAAEQVAPELAAAEQEQTNISMNAIDLEIEALQASEGVLAFPGALGYGKNTVGGRGGRIITVNTVENIVNPNDEYMSLREALTVETGPRTIVFSVGGLFDMGSERILLLGEADSYITVACQTAPSPGVVMKTWGIALGQRAHDIIFRHCVIRGDDELGPSQAQAGRSLTVPGGSYNIMLDHMSLSWHTDENFTVYIDRNQTEGSHSVTVSNSIVSEGDADSKHPLSTQSPQWGYHAMGPSCINNNTNVRPESCSFVNNFMAHNASRNAIIWGGSGEVSNNIVYNWFMFGVGAKTFWNSVDAHLHNNLMKAGPQTTTGSTSNPSCGPNQYKCALALGPSDRHGSASYNTSNNFYIGNGGSVNDAVLINNPLANTSTLPSLARATESMTDIRDMAMPGSDHLRCVGASKPSRDAIDARVIQEFHDGTGAIGIGSNNRTGGHNVNVQRDWSIYPASASHPNSYDLDKDGMPDEWEVQYGLNPQDPNDHSGDLDGDGYTNIEEYLAIAAAC